MTTEPFADQHAIIEAAQNRICEAEEQIYDALARIPKPPGAITRDDESWDYCDRAGAYARNLTMGRWDVAGGVRAEVALSAKQIETGALCDWSIYLTGHGLDAMTAEDARRVATALLDAAAAALEAGQQQHSEAGA